MLLRLVTGAMRPKRRIIAFGQRADRFGEHRGGDDSSDAWQGAENLDVTMLARFLDGGVCELVERAFDVELGIEALTVDKRQLGD